MATTGRPEEPATAASDVAASCREAGLVRLVGAARGDALAAVGLLAGALEAANVAHQTRLLGPGATATTATDADRTIGVGRAVPGAEHVFETAPVERAFAVATELGSPDPVLALAGTLAAGGVAEGAIHEAAMAADIKRRPGLAIPTADPVDGLAHSTLVHGPFSGDTAATASTLEAAGVDVDRPDDRRRLASLVALEIAAAAESGTDAGTAVERILRPYAGGPFETVGGYADVLDALARREPGLGIAVALGHGDAERALETWRAHGREVHRAVRDATPRRHDGLLVASVESVEPSALEPVARLLRDFRSPEPVVLVRSADRTVVATTSGRDAAALLAAGSQDREAPVLGDAQSATIPVADDALPAAVADAVGRDG